MENYEIGRFLRMKREALGYSREKVCGLCGGAFSTKTLSRMEKGKTKINRNTVQELLKLYHQRSHASCASMELVHISAGQMYNDILALMCRKDYKEAERRLELFERHVDGASKQDVQYVEVLRQGLIFYGGNKNGERGCALVFPGLTRADGTAGRGFGEVAAHTP